MCLKMCIIGHRYIEKSDSLIENIRNVFEKSILDNNVSVFLFGSKSAFDDLCYDIVSELKEQYPNIQRHYYMHYDIELSEKTKQSYLKFYEKVIIPENVRNSGKTAYIKRNQAMINESDICFFYYKENYVAINDSKRGRRSGTKLAFKYAQRKNKKIINIINKLA